LLESVPLSRGVRLLLPKMFPITPDARAGFSDDSARVARFVLFCRCARKRDCAATTAGGLRAGPSVDVFGDPKGFGVSPPVSKCRATGERQPLAVSASLSRIAVRCGLRLF
jgi:hypothetical protein